MIRSLRRLFLIFLLQKIFILALISLFPEEGILTHPHGIFSAVGLALSLMVTRTLIILDKILTCNKDFVAYYI